MPFTPTISITQTAGGPLITYTGVLLAGTNLYSITNVVAQSSGSTAISLGGPSQYSPSGPMRACFIEPGNSWLGGLFGGGLSNPCNLSRGEQKETAVSAKGDGL